MDGAVVRRWCRLAVEALAQTRSAIDALNVYPVPDADTGTNLYRTLRSAAEAVDALPETAGPDAIWQAAASGAMLGACGNSGIIVSQLFRGLADICATASPCDGQVVARALGHAAELARAAVSRPAEGTVLTVADAAARAAAGLFLARLGTESAPASAGLTAELTTGQATAQLGVVVLAAATAARRALALTTGQLEILAAAGVVDAGAAGLCVVLDAWAAAIAGTSPESFAVPERHSPAPGSLAPRRDAPDPSSCSYEVTYLLEAPADRLAGLREQLDSMGDSLVIAGGTAPAAATTGPAATAASPPATGLWHVHIHVPDAGAAIEAGLRAGLPRRITVTFLGAPTPAGHRVLAICDTAGMAALAESAGAQVLRSRLNVPFTADDVSAEIRQLARRCIIVPNGSAARAAATAAADSLRVEGIEVLVVDVCSPVQALPALAVHEPQAAFEADAAAMSRAAARMRYASISGPAELAAVLARTDELLAGGAELVTFLTAVDAPPELTGLAAAHVREVSPATEIETHAVAAAGAGLLVGAE
jgi:dihydroxyacetone kinase-like predicted kinase